MRLSVFFASVQMSMLLVIFCFWLVLRDRVFAYFVVYMAGQLVYQLAVTGELYALPGAAMLASLSYHPGQFAAIVSAALSISFMLDFADLPRNVPRLARVLAAMRWPYLVLALALWIPALQPDRWLPNIVNLMLVLTTSGALVAGWLAWRRGSRQAGFFLISWLPLLCLTVLRVAQLIFGLPLPTWLEYGFPATMAYAAIVIAIGLADRTLQARRERDQAHRLAEFDPLTGVLNRRAIEVRLRVAYADACHVACAELHVTRVTSPTGSPASADFAVDYNVGGSYDGSWFIRSPVPFTADTQFDVVIDPAQVQACTDVIFADGFDG